MMLKHLCWPSLLIAAVVFDLSAQTAGSSFRHVGPDQGLSHPDVFSITADDLGILWIATSAGLDRFDGRSVRPLAIDSDTGTTSEDLGVVFRDRGGDLWVGTWGHGLFHLSFPELEATAFSADPADPGSLSDDRVQGVFEDLTGALWVATFNGLDRLDRDRNNAPFSHFVHDPGDPTTLASNRVWGFAQAEGNDLWLAHDAGLDLWDGETETFRRVAGATPVGLRARCVLLARDRALWVGGQPGLRRQGDRGDRFVDFDLAGDGALPTINALFEDRAGVIWVGTLDQGLFRVDPANGSVRSFRAGAGGAAGLAADDVRAFHQGDDDLLWIGTRGGGVSVLDLRPSRFESITTPAVQDVIEASDGTIWVAGVDGLSGLDPSGSPRARVEVAAGGVLSDTPLRLEELDDGRLAIGARFGVVLYEPASGEAERLEHDPEDPASLVAGIVWALLADRSGGLWIGTDRGLDRFDPESRRMTHYRGGLAGPEGLLDAYVQTLYQADNGEIWVGTDLAGLFVLNAERRAQNKHYWHHPARPDSLADDRVTAILEDRGGALWIGSGGGLELMDRGAESFRHLAVDLPRLPILGLLEDDAGALWASTAVGLYRLALDRRRVDVYRAGRGLSGSVFSLGAADRGIGGDLLFGGLDGIARVKAESVELPSVPPRMVWTGLTVLNQARPFDAWTVPERLILAPGEWQFSVEFTALSYRDPRRHRFAAKLEGHDLDWIELGNRNTAAYTRVSPGDYLLRVRAANEEGVWSSGGLALPIRVRPALYQTVYFRLALGAAVLVLLFGVDRLRLAGMRRRRARLEAMVQGRTAEVESQKAELEVAYRRMEELSLSDPLTGLANRRFLTRTIDAIIAQSQRAARGNPEERLVFSLIDVDHFKRVNDRWGHDAGDLILQQFAWRLSELRRGEEPLVRWGGEEFLLVSRVERIEAAARLAERLRRAIVDQPFELQDGTELVLSCSIGFAPLAPDAAGTVSWESVVSLADKALYEAKTAGRDTWVGVELAAGVRSEDLDGRLQERLSDLIDEGLVEARRSTIDRE